jgi:hypothetical protein
MKSWRPKPQTVSLWTYAVAYQLAPHLNNPWEPLWNIILPWLIAEWILADARERRLHLCYDFDTFLFNLWQILPLIYLFKTRRLRAFIPIAASIAIWLTAFTIVLALDALVELTK